MENKDLIHKYMKLSLNEAKKAIKNDDIPIGAVIISGNGEIIGRGFNKVEMKKNPMCHAEIIAINQALKKCGDKYLAGASIFTTLEPCPLCATAISMVKIKNIYFGAYDTKGGAIVNGIKIFERSKNLFRPNIFDGIMESECSELITTFFENLRKSKKRLLNSKKTLYNRK